MAVLGLEAVVIDTNYLQMSWHPHGGPVMEAPVKLGIEHIKVLLSTCLGGMHFQLEVVCLVEHLHYSLWIWLISPQLPCAYHFFYALEISVMLWSNF